MSVFFIYFLTVTFAYIIYYGIMISQEIIKMKKSGASTTETFNMSFAHNPIRSRTVVDSPDGISIREDKPEEIIQPSEEAEQITDKTTFHKEEKEQTPPLTSGVSTGAPAAVEATSSPESEPAPVVTAASNAALQEARSNLDVLEPKTEFEYLDDELTKLLMDSFEGKYDSGIVAYRQNEPIRDFAE